MLNADNDISAAFRGNGTTRFFSRKGMAYVCIEDGVICRDGREVLPTKDILIPGVHNVENYMAAITVVEGLVSDETSAISPKPSAAWSIALGWCG